MNKSARLTFISMFGIVIACAVQGCKESALEPGAVTPVLEKSAHAFFDDDGAAVQVLDARNNEHWVYFDLDSYSVVFPQTPENDGTWDIAFRRFTIKTNGGVSGIGEVGVAAMHNSPLMSVSSIEDLSLVQDQSLSELTDEQLLILGENIFFAVCAPGYDDKENKDYCLANQQVNRVHLNPEESAYVFLTQGSGVVIDEGGEDGESILGWYDYYLHENHILRPTDDTWIIRSTEGNEFALEMLGYYGYEEGDAESGTVSFRYLSLTPGFQIPPPGQQQLTIDAGASLLSGTAPLSVTFSASASHAQGALSWYWDFGDGASSSLQNPEHSFMEPGFYLVNVSAIDERGATQAVQLSVEVIASVTSDQPPIADAGEDQIIVLPSGETEITVLLDASHSADLDGQIMAYKWTGTPDPDDVVTPELILSAGSKTFTLTVMDDGGNTDTDQVTVTVNSLDNQSPNAKASADITFGPKPLAVQFDGLQSSDADGTVVSWQWDFGDGSVSEYTADPLHIFHEAGHYQITLTVVDDRGAVSSTTVNVEVSLRATVTADTYVYEFLGNQGLDTGDSGGILVWNHESNHGAKALMALDASLLDDLAGIANYTAHLHLYALDGSGDPSGFIGAKPGDPDTDNVFTPGIATVKVDILPQTLGWSEAGEIAWTDIAETGFPTTTLTLDTVGTWVSVDTTQLVQDWVNLGSMGYGIAFSQEAYPVLRADNGSIPVIVFCDSESTTAKCQNSELGFDARPYLEIRVLP